MKRVDRRLVGQAQLIHTQWIKTCRPHDRIVLPEASWQRAQQFLQRIQRARRHNLPRAARRVQGDLRTAVGVVRDDLNRWEHRLRACGTDPPVPSMRDLYDDLVAMQEDFDAILFHPRRKTLSVISDPVVLEGVDLGRFEIRLDWRRFPIPHGGTYRVVAQCPHPPKANPQVTHPHVDGEILCEGEGRLPIQNALREGRLHDFFQSVAAVLGTYNGDDAHVSIFDWETPVCCDCRSFLDEDDLWYCEQCETTLCGDCYFACPDCGRIFCRSCLIPCGACHTSFCIDCICQCACCGHHRCQSCMEDHGALRSRCESTRGTRSHAESTGD